MDRALAYGHDALDVPPTGLDRFFAQHRKLLLSHGWADGLIPAQSTVNFYEALRKDIGSRRASEGVRLFMVPSMGHCAGGSGPSNIDYLGDIHSWVETGSHRAAHRQQSPRGSCAYATAVCIPESGEILGQWQHRRGEEFPLRSPLIAPLQRRCQFWLSATLPSISAQAMAIVSVTGSLGQPAPRDTEQWNQVGDRRRAVRANACDQAV